MCHTKLTIETSLSIMDPQQRGADQTIINNENDSPTMQVLWGETVHMYANMVATSTA